jgi:2,3-diphosphopglycerate-independent phosphoglycerate mutase
MAGFACGSDTAHLSMLGYDPRVFYRGRGAFESLGAGMRMGTGDIAFKCNFATFNTESGIVVSRRCDRDFTAEGPVLCKFLNGTTVCTATDGSALEGGAVVVYVQYATEHRCGVVVSGTGLSDKISGTDPLVDGKALVSCAPFENLTGAELAQAQYTCKVIDAVSMALQKKLHEHPINIQRSIEGKSPANVVLLRGAASKADLPSFLARHGLNAFMVAPTCIIRGLGINCGMAVVESEGGTGDYHTNILNKAVAVVEAFRRRPDVHFGVLHVKGVDDAGHDQNMAMKISLLRDVANALEFLWRELPEGSTVAVTGDHSTPVVRGDHCFEPVPVSIATKGKNIVDGVQRFDEISCQRGALGRFQGEQLVKTIKRLHFSFHYRRK